MQKSTANSLDRDIQAALKDIAKKYDVDFKMKKGGFSSTGAELTYEFTEKAKESDIYERDSLLSGFAHVKKGTKFTAAGKTYEVVGWIPRRPKYCLEAKELKTGKVFLFPRGLAEEKFPVGV